MALRNILKASDTLCLSMRGMTTVHAHHMATVQAMATVHARHMASLHGHIPKHRAYGERFDKYFEAKDKRGPKQVVGGKRVPTKYRVVPPEEESRKYEYAETVRQAGAGGPTWSDQSVDHPLPEDPVYQHYPQLLDDGVTVRYFGFDYYHPHPEQIETIPQAEVSPLFLVTKRFSKTTRIPWYQKTVFEDLGIPIHSNNNYAVICKNVPETNRKLWNIKNFIIIRPLIIPANLDLDADPDHCVITDDGELIYDPSLKSIYRKLSVQNPIYKTKISDVVKHREQEKHFDMPWNIKPFV